MVNGIGNPSNSFGNNINGSPYGGIPAIPGGVNDPAKFSRAEKMAETDGDYKCKTCAERRYKDGSDDGGVSFQSPTKINPGRSASAVMGHEREHYAREGAKAKREGKEVVSNTISIRYAVCPECGRRYASGGETRTVTKGERDDNKKKNADNNAKIDFSL